jgi:hypothetical protein
MPFCRIGEPTLRISRLDSLETMMIYNHGVFSYQIAHIYEVMSYLTANRL